MSASIDETTSRSFQMSLRIAAAFSAESDISQVCSASDAFVAGFESARHDCAVLVNKVANLGQDSTDRRFKLMSIYETSKDKILVPVDIKTISPTKYTHRSQRGNIRHAAHWGFHMTASQRSKAQVFIVSSLSDPSWVAVVPAYYVRMLPVLDETRPKDVHLGNVHLDLVDFSAWPPFLAPFVIPRDMLPKAMDLIAECATDPTKTWRNVYSGTEFFNHPPLELATFEQLLPSSPGSLTALRQAKTIYDAFHSPPPNINPQYQVRLPTHAPLTTDLKLVFIPDGRTVFFELKVGHCTVQSVANSNRILFRHLPGIFGKVNIFTHKAQFDFLLTQQQGTSWAYLISRDDIPRSFWNSGPNTTGFLEHVFDNGSFLDWRRVNLQDPRNIIQVFERVLAGPHAKSTHAGPMSAQFTPRMLPLPGSLLADEFRDRVDEEMIPDVEEEITKIGSGDALGRKGSFIRHAAFDPDLDARIVKILIASCRSKGKGVVIDLGPWHAFGHWAMIRHTWTAKEKEAYDRGRGLPCTFATLASNTPLVMLHFAGTPWWRSYAPLEPTPNRITRYTSRTCPPCLVICDPIPHRAGRLEHGRWIIPSQFMPKTSQDDSKVLEKRYRLFLKNEVEEAPRRPTVEVFTVSQHELHSNIYQFFSGETAEIGWGKVTVKTAPYLKYNVGTAKASAIINIDNVHRLRQDEPEE